MKDTNGVTIKVGDRVHTKQHSGGVLPPAKGETGIVEDLGRGLVISYWHKSGDFKLKIALQGQINTIIKNDPLF